EGRRIWVATRAAVGGVVQGEGCISAALGRLPTHRDGDAVVGADEIGELADVTDGVVIAESTLRRIVDGSEGRPVRGEVEAAGIGVALPRVVEPGEEPQTILDDVATERRPDVADVRDVNGGIDRRSGGHDLPGCACQASGSPAAEHGSVEFVPARLG